jgi:hypothetical protein
MAPRTRSEVGGVPGRCADLDRPHRALLWGHFLLHDRAGRERGEAGSHTALMLQYEPYRTLPDGLSDTGHPKLRAVRSTPDPNDDPFAVLGQDRLVYIGGVFPMDTQSNSSRIDLVAEDDGLSRINTPPAAASSLLDSPQTARLLARPALVSPPTGHRRQSPFPPSPPPEIKPPPWAHRELVRGVSSSPPLETSAPSTRHPGFPA